MSIYLLIAVTIAYAGIASVEAFKGNYPAALVFFGYTVANFGLMVTL